MIDDPGGRPRLQPDACVRSLLGPGALIALAAIFTADAGEPSASAARSRRPNVLWICSDDHAAYVTGAYGNRTVRTPNIDRLAGSAVRFDRAYCNSPVCTASRMSFLTGRYPQTIGVTQLATALPKQERTIAHCFAEAGYRTIGIGKMHFNGPELHGFDRLIDVAEYRQWRSERPAPTPPGGMRTLGPWRPFRDPAEIWLNADALPQPLPIELTLGRFLAESAAEFLSRKDDRPFFAFVSFHEPHSPFHFPIEFAGRHRAEEFAAPPALEPDRWQIPEIFAHLDDRGKRGIQAAYYTSTEFLDDCVGKTLDALDRAGLAETTLVLYTGDHGYMLGQHGRFEKHCGFEPAIRAPMLLRIPGRAGLPASTDALVEFVDVAPTLLDACGIDPPATMQGRSLIGLLEGKETSVRDAVFAGYSENEEGYVVEKRHKLIYGTGARIRQDGYRAANPLPGPYAKLYDLVDDPDELIDLSREPRHVQTLHRLIQRLALHRRQTARKPHAFGDAAAPAEVLAELLKPDDVNPADPERISGEGAEKRKD